MIVQASLIYSDGANYYVVGLSRTESGLRVGTDFRLLALGVDDVVLGDEVILSMANVTQGLPHLKSAEIEQLYKPLLQLARVRSLSALDSKSEVVSVSVFEDRTLVKRFARPAKGSGFLNHMHKIELPRDAGPAALGAAVREAFEPRSERDGRRQSAT